MGGKGRWGKSVNFQCINFLQRFGYFSALRQFIPQNVYFGWQVQNPARSPYILNPYNPDTVCREYFGGTTEQSSRGLNGETVVLHLAGVPKRPRGERAGGPPCGLQAGAASGRASPGRPNPTPPRPRYPAARRRRGELREPPAPVGSAPRPSPVEMALPLLSLPGAAPGGGGGSGSGRAVPGPGRSLPPGHPLKGRAPRSRVLPPAGGRRRGRGRGAGGKVPLGWREGDGDSDSSRGPVGAPARGRCQQTVCKGCRCSGCFAGRGGVGWGVECWLLFHVEWSRISKHRCLFEEENPIQCNKSRVRRKVLMKPQSRVFFTGWVKSLPLLREGRVNAKESVETMPFLLGFSKEVFRPGWIAKI